MVPLDDGESGRRKSGFLVAKSGSLDLIDLRRWRASRRWPGLAHGWSGASAVGRQAWWLGSARLGCLGMRGSLESGSRLAKARSSAGGCGLSAERRRTVDSCIWREDPRASTSILGDFWTGSGWSTVGLAWRSFAGAGSGQRRPESASTVGEGKRIEKMRVREEREEKERKEREKVSGPGLVRVWKPEFMPEAKKKFLISFSYNLDHIFYL